MHYLVLIAALVLGAICAYCVFNLLADSREVYARLDELMRLARAARSRKELESLQQTLADYRKSRCWNRRYAAHAEVVGSYIKGRIESYKYLEANP